MESRWTDVKIARLRVLAERGLTGAQIGKEIDFSRSAIISKASRLGIKLHGRKAGYFVWTPDKVNLLKSMADGTMSLKDMSVVFDYAVTAKGIGVKLRRLGISLDKIREQYSHERQQAFRAMLERQAA